MIYLITYEEWWNYDEQDRKESKKTFPVTMVSHGVDSNTLENVCLPQLPLSEYKVRRCSDTGELVLV